MAMSSARPSEQQLFEGWRSYWQKVKQENSVSNNITLGFGFNQNAVGQKFVAAKQKGPLPNFVYGMYPPPGFQGEVISDARADVLKTGTMWSASSETGIHAEALVIRSWLVFYSNTRDEMTMEDAFQILKKQNIYISASQAACWCCAALMDSMGIHYDKWDKGTKPLTGWRHPLGSRTIPNDEIPADRSKIDAEWLEWAKNYRGVA